MRIEKEKRKVNIVCHGDSLLKGFVHINPGERLLDFLNNSKDSFIAVTEAEFYHIQQMRTFRLFTEMIKKKNTVILNKASIKLMEEI